MARPAEGVDTADPRREAVVGIFGDEAVFDAHAFKGDVFLRIAEGFAEADADLLGDDVDVALSLDLGNAGGDAVFHLNAGVHFHKEGAAVLGDDPFPRAHVVVTDLAGQREGVAGDVFQQLVRVEIVFDGRGVETGRDFDTLLEAGGLDRAVAGAEVDRVFAAPVGDDLHFKVVEAADALFDEHAFVLELAERVVADTPVHGAELIDVVHFLNAHAAAARGSLDEDQRAGDALLDLEVVKAPGDFFGFHFVVNGAVGTGNRGHAEAAGKAFGIDFIAELPDDPP